MVNADLKLYIGSTEYGTEINKLVFPTAVAGSVVPHASNPIYLWNDKGGTLGSVPARNVNIECLNMSINDELLGTSNGTPSQVFTASLIPIVDNNDPDEIIVKVGTVEWERAGTFVGRTSTETIYTINPVTGDVTFGDGVFGAIPPNGQNIYITYMPDLLSYGSEIYENTWLEVQSFGVTPYTVTEVDELETSTDTLHVALANTNLTGVTGVWLQSDPFHLGTNYYTGGSYNATLGVVTLGTALPGATTGVLVNYTYQAIDDLEGDYFPIGYQSVHTFANPIPRNNAKLLYFRLNVPATATPSGGGQVNFKIRVIYTQ